MYYNTFMKLETICLLIFFLTLCSCNDDNSFFCTSDEELLASECLALDLADNLCSPYICQLNDPLPGQEGDFIIPPFDLGCDFLDCTTLVCNDVIFEGLMVMESQSGAVILTGDNFMFSPRLSSD